MDETDKKPAATTAGGRKKRGPVARLVPWILGALIGGALIWLFANIVDIPDQDTALAVDTLQSPNLTTNQPVATEPKPAVDRVADFIRFSEQGRAARIGPEHVYVSDGIDRLAASIDALSEQFVADSMEMEPKLKQLRAYAASLQRDPGGAGQSAEARRAFELAAGMMSSIQKRTFPQAAAQVEQIRRAAGAVSPDRPLTDQITIVEAYFRQVAETLQTMMMPES